MFKPLPILAIGFALLLTACASDIQLLRPIVSCEYNGENYAVGAGNIPAKDGSNTCFCGEDGQVSCTEFDIPPAPVDENGDLIDVPNGPASKCVQDGFKYEWRGGEFPEGEGFCLNTKTGSECPDQTYYDGSCTLTVSSFTIDLKTDTGIVQGGGALSYDSVGLDLNITAKDLPLLSESEVYNVWALRVEPYDTVLLGPLASDPATEFASFVLADKSTELADYERIMIRRQADGLDDFGFGEILLEGVWAAEQ